MVESELRLVASDTVNECCRILESRKLHGLQINLSYHNEVHLPICAFKDPNYIVLSLPRASSSTRETLHDQILRAMASLADHRKYILDRDAMNGSAVVTNVPAKKPVYNSPIWQQYYLLFKGSVVIKAVYNDS